jgi:VCBS repeat-containing protein
MTALRLLTVDISDNDEGIVTIEALASTSAAQHAAALAEAQAILDWAWRAFAHTHAPADDGGEWDHDLQVHAEDGGWHAVTLTLTGTPEFARAFHVEFEPTPD